MENKTQKQDEHEGRNFTDLPAEIIEKIFDYLTPRELITVSQVCRQYFEIAQSATLGRKIRLKILINYNTQVKYEHVLQKSKRKFFNLYMKGKYRSDYIPLRTIANIYSKIESIVLAVFKIPSQKLWEILQYTKNLRSLTLKHCEVTRVDDHYLENISEIMGNLTELIFDGCYITLKNCDWFLESIKLTSNLKKLYLNFNDSDIDMLDEASVLESRNMQDKIICSFIEQNQTTLKELHIFKYNSSTDHLSDKMKCLNLEKLYLHPCRLFDNESMINLNSFLEPHRNLTTLKVYITDRTVFDLNNLAGNMNQLVELKVCGEADNCNDCNLNLLTISKFKKLKILELWMSSGQVSLSREVTTNFVLHELNLEWTELTNNDIFRISENCPNLELLRCLKITLTDDGLQAVIKQLSKLKHLDLDGYFKITDFGISGFNCETNEHTGVSIKQLENLEYLVLRRIIDLSESCLINNIQFSRINKILIRCKHLWRSVNLEQVKIRIIGNCPKLEYKNLNI